MRTSCWLFGCALTWLAPNLASAQDIRPGDERPQLPAFEEPATSESLRIEPLPEVPNFEPLPKHPGSVLPPLGSPGVDDTGALAAGARVGVFTIEIRGNSALAREELEAIALPYVGRELSFADIQDLRDELTRAYVDAGYVTSGAVVPDQTVVGGVLVVEIVEGRLDAVEIETDGRFRPGYLRSRLERSAGEPVNVRDLEEGLQILQQDDRIATIHAALVPGEERGSSVLRVQVEENRPLQVALAGNNYNSPSIGGGRGEVRIAYANLTGMGDAADVRYTGGRGYQEIGGSFAIPVTPWDTSVELHVSRTWSEIVEKPFDALDITSEAATYGFTVTQPLSRKVLSSVDAFVTGEYRESKSYLLGQPFSFVLGPIDGIGQIAVLRLGFDATYSSRTQAIATRWMVSAGLDALGATEHSGDTADGQFAALLGQFQWARRFPALWDLSFVIRGDLQLANEPLLGLEQYSIGGHATVRGYRENQLARDNGTVGSFELRIPVPLPRFGDWRPYFELAPFVDAGHSWNTDTPNVGPKTLISVGIGGRLAVNELLRFQIYWGHRLKEVPRFGEKSLQDDGLELGVTYEW